MILDDDISWVIMEVRTIARFLKVNETEVKKLFLQVLQLCIALEMVSFGQFSLDGTKIKANAFKSGSIKAEVIEKRIIV